jgi:hypothetical protein
MKGTVEPNWEEEFHILVEVNEIKEIIKNKLKIELNHIENLGKKNKEKVGKLYN